MPIQRSYIEDKVIRETADEVAKNAMSGSAEATKKKSRRQRTKRQKMSFRFKTLLFFALMFIMLFIYVLAFLNGNQVIADFNNWTDTFASSFFTFLFGTGTIGSALSKVFTLGPMSYILFSVFIVGIITIVTAIVYSFVKTKQARARDGDNFLREDIAKLSDDNKTS